MTAPSNILKRNRLDSSSEMVSAKIQALDVKPSPMQQLVPDVLNSIARYLPDGGFMLRSTCKQFKAAIKPSPDMYWRICEVAAGQGWLGVLKWARKVGYGWDK